jgi:hypothetical protein
MTAPRERTAEPVSTEEAGVASTVFTPTVRERENTMTSQSPQSLPLAAAIAREATDADESPQTGPTVGASDAEADAIGSGADADLAGATRDSDGVPVGRDDVEADKRASGA